MNYLLNLLIAIDQLATALCGGFPDETLSSYAHRMYSQGKPLGFFRHMINFMFFWQVDHCYQAYLSEMERRQLPPALR